MILLVIRHGESEADLLNVYEGRADYPLTPKGIGQAQRLSEWVSQRYAVTKIYTSPLKRAQQTAELLSAAAGVAVTEDDALMEFNNGLIAGLPKDEADAKYPLIPDLPLHEAAYGQESLLAFRFRADTALSKILSDNPEDAVVAVVSHGGMINQLYRAFLGLPVDSDVFVHTADTGIHEWIVSGGRRGIVYANSRLHILS